MTDRSRAVLGDGSRSPHLDEIWKASDGRRLRVVSVEPHRVGVRNAETNRLSYVQRRYFEGARDGNWSLEREQVGAAVPRAPRLGGLWQRCERHVGAPAADADHCAACATYREVAADVAARLAAARAPREPLEPSTPWTIEGRLAAIDALAWQMGSRHPHVGAIQAHTDALLTEIGDAVMEAAARSALPPSVEGVCVYAPHISRVCERGSSGCTVRHAAALPRVPEPDLERYRNISWMHGERGGQCGSTTEWYRAIEVDALLETMRASRAGTEAPPDLEPSDAIYLSDLAADHARQVLAGSESIEYALRTVVVLGFERAARVSPPEAQK